MHNIYNPILSILAISNPDECDISQARDEGQGNIRLPAFHIYCYRRKPVKAGWVGSKEIRPLPSFFRAGHDKHDLASSVVDTTSVMFNKIHNSWRGVTAF
ncbi:hypothetical protein [Aquitalea denitrificans]|uniref:hypothetical protein n=1 Tax=Aquitalea denitrificans TaxID=519081 RepID=UPI0013581D54|nr:hypothetical protein [Aquitalea denitrificans]